MTGSRPSVTVIVPFKGGEAEARELLGALRGLVLRPGDRVLVVDNSTAPVVAPLAGNRLETLRADAEYSSYYARNVGAEAAVSEWLLFLDGDTRPLHADLVDRHFAPVPDERCGALAGAVHGRADQSGLLARHARSRRRLDQEVALAHPYRPFGLTANLAVRRAAWDDAGGFCEGVRSAGDQDFSWRLQELGWSIGWRPEAAVEHVHREALVPTLRQLVRYGAGTAWLARRHGRAANRRPVLIHGLTRCAAGVVVWGLSGQRERAVFKALDALSLGAVNAGFMLENRPPVAAAGAPGAVPGGTVLLTSEYPTAGTDAAAVDWVEAERRPLRPRADLIRGQVVLYTEDDGYGRRLLALLWWIMRSPGTVLTQMRTGPRGVFSAAAVARRAAVCADAAIVHECSPLRAAIVRGLANLPRRGSPALPIQQ